MRRVPTLLGYTKAAMAQALLLSAQQQGLYPGMAALL